MQQEFGASKVAASLQESRTQPRMKLDNFSATPNQRASSSTNKSDTSSDKKTQESASISPIKRPELTLARQLEPTIVVGPTGFGGNKFHRAAIDGYVDMLCGASKRDTNMAAADHQLQLTPTLLAALHGQLEALRILVGRGGDPERVSSQGSSALHLAASRNHLNCVSFLVNFGVNMWALDDELRTAKDVAAIKQCKETLDYLDQVMAKQSAINTKLVQKFKDKAKNAAEKRLKHMRKLQLKAIKQVERDERLLAKMSQSRRLLKAAHSMSDIRLVGRVSGSTDLQMSQQQQQHQLLSQQQHVVSMPSYCDNAGEQAGRDRKLAAATGADSKSMLSNSSSISSGSNGNKNNNYNNRIANYIQQRLQDDLLAGTRRARAAQLHQQHPQLFASASTSTSSASPASSSSYPGSSVSSSSTSGYLSSFSAKSILKSAGLIQAQHHEGADKKRPNSVQVLEGKTRRKQDSRPKYSDLVAVKREELNMKSSAAAAATPTRGSNSSSELTTRKGSIATSADNLQETDVKQKQPAPPSNKESSSILASKLRILGGGVSRKVHLKRLLFASSSCDIQLTPLPGECVGGATTSAAKSQAKFSPSSANRNRSQARVQQVSGKHKSTSASSSVASSQLMKRAQSVPDFGAASPRQTGDDSSDDSDVENGQQMAHRCAKLKGKATPLGSSRQNLFSNNDDDDEEKETRNTGRQQLEQDHNCGKRRIPEAVASTEHYNGQHPQTAANSSDSPPLPPPLPLSQSESSRHPAASDAANLSCNERKHKHCSLLNQCLSQLRVQQRKLFIAAANTNGVDDEHDSSADISAGRSAGMDDKRHQQLNQKIKQQFSHSDELLQHQLEAGQFPVKPSIIKHQQQQLKLAPLNHNHANSSGCSSSSSSSGSSCSSSNTNCLRSADESSAAKKSIASVSLSADSIGSVSSFVAKNFRPDSLSPSHRLHQDQQKDAPSNLSAVSSSSFQSYELSNNSSSNNPSAGDLDHDQCRHYATDLSSNCNNNNSAEQRQLIAFLAENNLSELFGILTREHIDLEALLLLNDTDLKSLNILLGPRKKLLNAIEIHKRNKKKLSHGLGADIAIEAEESSRLVKDKLSAPTAATIVMDTQF